MRKRTEEIADAAGIDAVPTFQIFRGDAQAVSVKRSTDLGVGRIGATVLVAGFSMLDLSGEWV